MRLALLRDGAQVLTQSITNPIFLINGPEPAGNEPVEAPPNP